MPASASFNPSSFDELIENQGYNAYWDQAIVCECYKNGQPDIHCPLCLGQGIRYIRKREIKVVSSSFSGNQELKLEGLTELGQVYVTPQRDVIMGYQDILDFYEIECRHSQTLEMKKNNTSRTERPIKTVSFVMQEKRIYEEGIDFVISDDRHGLLWITDEHKPIQGSKISVLYMTSPRYIIKDLAHELRSTRVSRGTQQPYFVDMPKQYLAKRLDFEYGQNVNVKKDLDEVEWHYE